MTRPAPDDDDHELLVQGILRRTTHRELAEEILERCACTFDRRLPDDAGPVYECDYHRDLRARREKAP